MAIKLICNRCKKELNEFRAILFNLLKGKDVKKSHICKKHYEKIKSEWNLSED